MLPASELCVRELGELKLSRKTELEFGLSSLGSRDPVKVLEQWIDLAKASFRSLSWQPDQAGARGPSSW